MINTQQDPEFFLPNEISEQGQGLEYQGRQAFHQEAQGGQKISEQEKLPIFFLFAEIKSEHEHRVNGQRETRIDQPRKGIEDEYPPIGGISKGREERDRRICILPGETVNDIACHRDRQDHLYAKSEHGVIAKNPEPH